MIITQKYAGVNKKENFMTEYLKIIGNFDIDGEVLSVKTLGDGHINSTVLVSTDKKRFVLQRVNSSVFKDVEGLMSNVFSVTEYLTSIGVETLCFLRTKDGAGFVKDGESYYRMYAFIEDTVTYQTVTDANVFKNSGAAFGKFQNQLAGFDASVLLESIPDFHNTPKRYNDFINAVNANICGRAKTCKAEIDFIVSHKDTYSKVVEGLADGSVPLRVTHNDTKLNNILMDAKTNEARAIIDLDTIMPGSMLYDFGDSIRFGASSAAEDEPELDKVHFDISLYEAYASGFCPEVKGSITQREIELLPYSAYLMTIECGMRFLADYLSGDKYFATKYPEHNLVRARTQIKLAGEMEASFDEMLKISQKYCN